MGNCSCDDSDHESDICSEIFHIIEKALVQDKGNLYRSRKVFFYGPTADPVLLRVECNVTFAENITAEVLPNCTDLNTSESIALNQTNIIRRWTSRGTLYLWIEPLFLSRMQMALPFNMLRYLHKKV